MAARRCERLKAHVSFLDSGNQNAVTVILARTFYRGAENRLARRWFRAILKDNRKDAALSLRIIEEYRKRDAGLDDAFRAYTRSVTENVRANLFFYGYLKLKKRGPAKARSAAPERIRQRMREAARDARSATTAEMIDVLADRKRARSGGAEEEACQIVVIDPGRSSRKRPGKGKRAVRKARKRAEKEAAAGRESLGRAKGRKKDRKAGRAKGKGKKP